MAREECIYGSGQPFVALKSTNKGMVYEFWASTLITSFEHIKQVVDWGSICEEDGPDLDFVLLCCQDTRVGFQQPLVRNLQRL